MTKFVKREVYYFDEPGEHNTELVVEAVSKRLEKADIVDVVVASVSGVTALKFATALKGIVKVICVSGMPYRREWGKAWPSMKPEVRAELEKLDATIIERGSYLWCGSVLDAARWPTIPPELFVGECLAFLGQGLKVAVEVVLLATLHGYVKPLTDAIGVGGSDKGADTAIVLKATYPAAIFSRDPSKRLEIREIIAMPRTKKWWEPRSVDR